VLPGPTTATRQLEPVIAQSVTKADLPALRRVQRFAVHAAEALRAGRRPDCTVINALGRGSTAHLELATTTTLRQQMVWSDASISSGLARRLIAELAALEPDRLRRCARTECGLLFYDTTRSRTRRCRRPVWLEGAPAPSPHPQLTARPIRL
jgi:predicted RNA-binding Zn ribbon-like protein